MQKTESKVRVAVVQAASIIMDLEGTLEKTIQLIKQAGKKNVNLIIFPEAFISAYPRGLSFGCVVGSRTMEGRRDWKKYYDSSITVPSEETNLIGEAAKEAGVYVSIGVIEKDASNCNSTLYCTNLFFSPHGDLIGKHRKLKPTGSERLVWGEGDGSTLTTVDTPFGRMGSLICWENYMPLARAAMYQKGVKIYITPTADSREEWQHTIQHIALEGRCFVLNSNQYVNKSMYPKDLEYYDDLEKMPEECCLGGSCIINPFGKYVAEPVWGREDIIVADLDMGDIILSRLDFDPCGHYSRPDIFELIIHE